MCVFACFVYFVYLLRVKQGCTCLSGMIFGVYVYLSECVHVYLRICVFVYLFMCQKGVCLCVCVFIYVSKRRENCTCSAGETSGNTTPHPAAAVV